MSKFSRTLVTPPTAPALEVAAVKPWVRMDGPDDDAVILDLIAAAEELAQKEIDRQFVTATWLFGLRAFPRGLFRVPRAPLRSVVGITYYDPANVQQTLEEAAYLVDAAADPGTIEPAGGWTWPATYDRPDAVGITVTAGYGTPQQVPRGILLALRYAVAWGKEHRGDEKDDMSLMTKAVKNALALYWDGCLEYGEACV